MEKPLTISFPGGGHWVRAEVGGKAASLIRMAEAGLPVPAGAVLTNTFFTPWFDEIRATPTWNRLVESRQDHWGPLCDELKRIASGLALPASRMYALRALHRNLLTPGGILCFAVRSSAPQEDGVSSSFAGLYETRLGVRPDDLENAVRACFAAALDARVLVYQRERGLALWAPELAVIIQRQIDSEVAGVGFSLNPITNDYDEAVIDASWGLGTSVVEGRVIPDHFVVNRVERRIVEEQRGAKTISIVLDQNGGISERPNRRAHERTLSDRQLFQLVDVIGRIEAMFDAPVDVEWAYAGGELHILQARPIPTYVPLPAELVTLPGERRRLYVDAALSKGMTMNRPISTLGQDAMRRMFTSMFEPWTGPLRWDCASEDALLIIAGGRLYMNLSSVMWLFNPGRMVRAGAMSDALMAEILARVDVERYRSTRRPSWAGLRLFVLVPRVIWSLRRFFWNMLYVPVCPERAHRWYRRKVDALECRLRNSMEGGVSLEELQSVQEVFMRELFDTLMSVLIAGLISPDLVLRRGTAEEIALADRLKRGVEGDVVVEMGIALYRLAQLLDASEFDDLAKLQQRIENRELTPAFMDAWDDFINNFGCRGPQEMDIASPRYGDAPRLALLQMSYMAGEGGFDPGAAHQSLVEERRQAFAELMRRSGPLRRILLRRIYRLNELFAGTRDTPKHMMVLANYAFRKHALKLGRGLKEEGRLDAVEDVFYLTLDELKAAVDDDTLDLRSIMDARKVYRNKLDAHVPAFPTVIDSRGRILRPPPGEDTEHRLHGMPVSAGVASGRIKVLHSADEKPIEKGDVLVAYATDPGWTPLFVNAAAIVLEVGGILQHGAVVAREYGKPCVVGIDRVTVRLRDGELVEVDGGVGTVSVLS